MKTSRTIQSMQAVHLLSDPRRLRILRQLMAAPATLTQLGRSQGLHPARIRHHLKRLEDAGLVELASTRVVRGFVEKYYTASASAYFIHTAVLPEAGERETIFIVGSHDPALDMLAGRLDGDASLPQLVAVPVGSLDGLIALRQGLCQLSASHLYDPGGEYNQAQVRQLFPGRHMHLVTLAHRTQGLLVAHGNPHGIRGLADLARREITFVNRRAGSGTRLWLDDHLNRAGISTQVVRGYTHEVATHTQVALAIANGGADAGLGVLAAAHPYGLDFVPLFEERFDLVIPDEAFKSSRLAALLGYVQTVAFRKELAGLGGYDARQTGREVHL